MNRLALLLLLLWSAATPALAQTRLELAWPDTDFSRQIVDLHEIRSGGPPKDGIPSIDAPEFERVADASAWIDPLEPVIALAIGEQAKAYPLQILIYHEIVNDEIAGVPVAVTFCPLCNASIVFDRRLHGDVLDFGTTGLLRMSDLVMYDRQARAGGSSLPDGPSSASTPAPGWQGFPPRSSPSTRSASPFRTGRCSAATPAIRGPTGEIPITATTGSTSIRSCSDSRLTAGFRPWSGY
ncbi:MAG: DUF3179 domain-containing protein [Gammaproteobacteria bacterium]|nr:DUF3179 domain-containing protein [Gammaproteobacteria bacterium]MYJ51950.1 DUF3179 domain-containing protein [Gammaproteobacteria bacterium]